MEFTTTPARAMTWPSLAAAGRSLDNAFEFGPKHQLFFVKTDELGRLQPRRGGVWACQVFNDGKCLGYLARYVVRDGRAEFIAARA